MNPILKSPVGLKAALFAIPFISLMSPSAYGLIEDVVRIPVNAANAVVRTIDREVVRRQLSVPPQVVVVERQSPAAGTVTVVETTRPRRVYNMERSVVVVENEGKTQELTYVTLPVLFEVETNALLDQESRAALEEVARVILAISKEEPGTQFDIEGHTSTEGTDEYNMALSAARAKKVFEELTQRYGIPASLLTAHGYGENFPTYPEGSEAQKQLDRRVLVVRTK